MDWTSKKEWGSVGNTYRAAPDGWSYAIDQPVKGQWVLCGRGPDNRFLYRPDFRTVKSAKAAAEQHYASANK